jgi:ATP-binding cassette subfamily G (WHITE) protein 2 (SNQ2)
LDVLAGKKTVGRIYGEYLVNGKPLDGSFATVSGYVEQFDSHNELSTVKEAIAFNARLRCPQAWSEQIIEEKVNNVMRRLGIDHLADERIGNPNTDGVSPEVRKKVTIALELVTEPKILFCDEPTVKITTHLFLSFSGTASC